MQRTRRFFVNAVILCATSITLRLVGIFFNAFLVKRVGAAGIGLYQLIASVYFFGITLACSGVHMAVTRLVARELARDNPRGVRCAVAKGLLYGAGFGLLAFALLFFCAEPIAKSWLGDARVTAPLRIMAVSLPFIALSACIKGYFTAVRRVSRNAAADIFEQLLRMGIVVICITRLFPSGLQGAVTAIALGGMLAEALSFALMLCLHLGDRRRFPREGKALAMGEIFAIALPVAFSSYLRAGLTSINQFLVPSSLTRYGFTRENSLAQYGLIQGMAFPIIQLPEMFLASFAALLVPELTDFYEKKDAARIERTLRVVLRATLLFSFGAVGVLMCFARELSTLVYSNTSAAAYLALLAPLAVCTYLDKVVDSTLTGLHQHVRSLFYNLAETILSTILILLLVPRLGIYGYIAVLYAGKAVNMGLSLGRLVRVTDFRLDFFSWVLCPAISMATCCSSLSLLRGLYPWPFSVLFALFIAFYVLLLWLSGSLRAKGEGVFALLRGSAGVHTAQGATLQRRK